MDHPNYQEGAPSAPNPPPYSKEQLYSQQTPPAYEPVNPAVPAQYQPYYFSSGAVPSQGPVIQPPLHTNFVIPVQPSHEPDYMMYSILTMLFCCLPLGIAAVVYSGRTRNANQMGNGAKAQWNSRMAWNFANAALGVGTMLTSLSIIFIVVTWDAPKTFVL